ncbi:MAG: type I methionyl aminopeptidase [Clostridia bacterium]|nr:type I methionyl aminopeptidase [Clostridia bacterium]
MIQLKNKAQIDAMRDACRISGEALALGGEHVKPGVTTGQINEIIHRYILKQGATPSFLGYGGFPGSACISVNDEVIHGIPGNRELKDGDVVKIDVGAYYRGYHGDNANTFIAGKGTDEAEHLVAVTRQCFYEGLKLVKAGNRLGDLGHSIQEYVEANGCSVVREYVGHGIGKALHEDPNVPNYGSAGRGLRLLTGMVIAIEPMVCAGDHRVRVLPDKWTVVTCDGKPSAHYEHTVALTEHGVELLTKID